MKRKPKSIAKLKKDLDKVFNAFIRRRDKWTYINGDGFTCISCGEDKSIDQMHAGHFFPSTFTAVRWNEMNVHGQCAHCNTFLHGNLYEYSKRLAQKIGIDKMNNLELMKHRDFKLDRQWLEERIEHYKSLI